MRPLITGIHHITAIAGNPQKNIDFYTGILGLRLVKKTINFDARTPDIPPVYKNDCLPDPPQLRNPYVWDGQSPQGPATQPIADKLDPEAYAECLKQLSPDSMDAEIMHDQLQLDRWASEKLKPR